jgi:two-component system, NarL family, nitrate/nitrite response regulator NarL
MPAGNRVSAMAAGRLILAGDSGLFREGLKSVLTERGLSIVGEVLSLPEALILLRSLGDGVDLVVYDQPEAQARQFEPLKRLTREFPKTPVVILADRMDAADVDKAVAAGASGFLPKRISATALGLSLELITLGENLFTAPASLWRHQPAGGAQPPSPEVSKTALTNRQRQILEYLEAGLSNRAIAEKLDVAEATVKVHVRSLLLRINVDNRTQAALWAKNQK